MCFGYFCLFLVVFVLGCLHGFPTCSFRKTTNFRVRAEGFLFWGGVDFLSAMSRSWCAHKEFKDLGLRRDKRAGVRPIFRVGEGARTQHQRHLGVDGGRVHALSRGLPALDGVDHIRIRVASRLREQTLSNREGHEHAQHVQILLNPLWSLVQLVYDCQTAFVTTKPTLYPTYDSPSLRQGSTRAVLRIPCEGEGRRQAGRRPQTCL